MPYKNENLLDKVIEIAEKSSKTSKKAKSFRNKIDECLSEDIALERENGWEVSEHRGVDKAIEFIESSTSMKFNDEEHAYMVSDLMKRKMNLHKEAEMKVTDKISNSVNSITSRVSQFAGSVFYSVTDPILNNVPGIATTKKIINPKAKCSDEWALVTGQYKEVKSNSIKDARMAAIRAKKVLPLAEGKNLEELSFSSETTERSANREIELPKKMSYEAIESMIVKINNAITCHNSKPRSSLIESASRVSSPTTSSFIRGNTKVAPGIGINT
ncbi:MAG: hypothetical protein WBJ81_00815 [Rickettsiales bacterium]